MASGLVPLRTPPDGRAPRVARSHSDLSHLEFDFQREDGV